MQSPFLCTSFIRFSLTHTQPKMEEQIAEIVSFLADPKPEVRVRVKVFVRNVMTLHSQVKLLALEHIVGLTASPETQQFFAKKETISSLSRLIGDSKVRCGCVRTLMNARVSSACTMYHMRVCSVC